MIATRFFPRRWGGAWGVLVLIVLALALLRWSPEVRASDTPAGMPPDVAEAVKRLKSGQYSAADVQRVQQWSQQLQSSNLNLPGAGGGTQFGPASQPQNQQGIPCRVEATIQYTATAGHENIRVQMNVWADALVFASVRGNADYNLNILNPAASVSSFRFEPLAPGGKLAAAGGGSMTRVTSTGTDTLAFTQAAASMMFVSTGTDVLYPQGGSNIGGVGDGTSTSGGRTTALHGVHSETNEVLSVPFVLEANQQAQGGIATPRPTMQISLAALTAAVQSSAQTLISAGESFDFTNRGGSHVTGQSTLKITVHPAPSALRLKPANEKDYMEWLPVPWDVDGDDAAMYRVNPRDPNGGLAFWVGFEDPGRSCKINVELRDVNDAQGLSTNYPPTGATTRKGLHFLPSNGIQFPPGDHERQRASTTGSVPWVTVRVAAEDTGAWGSLVAFCEDHPQDLATISGKTTHYLPIPFDDDENHIAHAYWDLPGNAPLVGPVVDEDDNPAGQPEKGDGYTTYEEYRGFVVLTDSRATTRKFIRPSPHRKDVFVYDRDGLIKTHYEPHNTEAANLELHYVSPALMQYDATREAYYGVGNYAPNPSPVHRWVNINTPDPLRFRRQYAVVEFLERRLADPKTGCVEGETQKPVDVDWLTTYARPLFNFAAARVNDTCSNTKMAANARNWLGARATPELIQDWQARGLTNTVIHEFGHAIGIPHHRKETTIAGFTVAYDENHDPTTYGPIACAMRYANNPRDNTRASKENPALLHGLLPRPRTG